LSSVSLPEATIMEMATALISSSVKMAISKATPPSEVLRGLA
jgi:hypothetical protein